MGIMEKEMETTIVQWGIYGWLSKLWPLFGYPKYSVP